MSLFKTTLLFSFVTLYLVSTSTAIAAPITFNTALPISEGEFVYRQQFRVIQAGKDETALNRDQNVFAAISVLGYGVNSKLAIFMVVPWLQKEIDLIPVTVSIRRENKGPADLTAFGRFLLVKKMKKDSHLVSRYLLV